MKTNIKSSFNFSLFLSSFLSSFLSLLLPICSIGCLISFNVFAKRQTIQFLAKDKLKITADLYLTKVKQAPFIILFHQAGFSRGEYLEIAPKLNMFGFNCIAIDQRSGDRVNGVINQTAENARRLGVAKDFISAYTDLESSVTYIIKKYNPKKIVIWGSSYSAGLVFKLAKSFAAADIIKAVIAFSPAEYFERFGKSKNYVASSAKQLYIKVFITSSKAEHLRWENIYKIIPSKSKTGFIPKMAGRHGSSTLWEKTPGHQEYWAALNKFLKSI